MNENEVGAKHLVMIITNDVFCNKYGYDRQGKKEDFACLEEIFIKVLSLS